LTEELAYESAFTPPSGSAVARQNSGFWYAPSRLIAAAFICIAGAFFYASGYACTQIQSSSDSNVAEYHYDEASGDWVLVDEWYDEEVLDYEPQSGDYYQVIDSEGIWLLYTSIEDDGSGGGGSGGPGGPPGGTDPQGSPTEVAFDSGFFGMTCGEEPIEIPGMTVTGSSVGWGAGTAIGMMFMYQSGGGGGAGPVRVGYIVISASDWVKLAEGIHELTVLAALKDIETFREIGDHYPYPQGSLINWAQAQVNWNDYGAADSSLSDEQVLQNFIDGIEGGDG